MKKLMICVVALVLAGCTFGGSAAVGGGSNSVGMGLSLGTGFRF